MNDANIMRIGGTSVLRNPQLEPLEDAQLKRFAPTIFAKRPVEGVSDNYGFVKTNEIINAMRDNGFECVEVRQSQRRDAERMPFTKHMLKFKPKGTLKSFMKVGDVIPQAVLLNSHDRSSGFHLYMGMYRLVCSNGLIVAAGNLVEPLKLRHTATMVADVVKRSEELIKGADGVYRVREEMLKVQLTQKEMLRFATDAMQYRPPRRSGIMDPASLIEVRRDDDKPNDLWHVFNRVQENMLRGGAATVTAEGRAVQTKGIGRIERDVEVNKALWELAMSRLNGKRATRKAAAEVGI